jgi:signal peptidase I
MKKIIVVVIISLPSLFSCKGRIYRSPSASMAETIREGETFYVSKTKSFERNDIVVFNYYGNDYALGPDEKGRFKQHWEKRFYRLIALSGDSLNIKDGDVIVNDKYIPEVPTILNEYKVYAKEYIDDLTERSDDYLLPPLKDRFGDTIVYQVSLTREEVYTYEQRKQVVIRIKKIITLSSSEDTLLARPARKLLWTVDTYGPLYIPQPGETITVTNDNYQLYKNIPGIQLGKNILKEKLYFVMGDNRHRAEDSRYIGFIPQSNMYGIVK